MKSAPTLTILGGILPVLSALALLLPPAGDGGTWAYPVAPGVHTAGSILLALSHLLVLVGFVVIARRAIGVARIFAWVGALGTVVIAAAEVWSGTIPTAPLTSDTVSTLNTVYTVSSLLIIAGSIGAGISLLRSWRSVGLPLLVSGAVLLLIATPAIIIGDNTVRVLALTGWNLLYVWLGFALRGRAAGEQHRG